MIKEKKNQTYIYLYRVCYIFSIFKFILIYLLHLLFVLKIKGIFEKRKTSPKEFFFEREILVQKSWKKLFSLYII